ncbi:MAG: PA14 domain-containing protein, partial [Candidatus Uhrbacteria bacterium]|nr:PA14 domain-containing protein [Candidatus Uhrbacteria bacterium]
NSAKKYLEAGHRYFIKMEYFEKSMHAMAQLHWSRKKSPAKTLVPQARLFPEPYDTTTPISSGAFRIGTGNGLRGEYYSDENLSNFVLPRIDQAIGFDWGTGAPDPAVPADHFSVRWTGWIEPTVTDTYTFYTLTDDGVRLWISDKDQNGIVGGASPLIDRWQELDHVENSAKKYLEAGHRYFIKMEYFEKSMHATAQLFWSNARQSKEIVPQSQLYAAPETIVVGPPPGNGTGLRGRYYRGSHIAYDNALPYPAVERIDPMVDFAWRYGVPYYSIPATNFSIRWEGYIQPQFDGDYTFYLQSDDSARLWVEESTIYDSMPHLINRGTDTYKEHSATKTLQKDRLYRIRIDYSQGVGDAYVHLWWSHAQLRKQIIPRSQFYPPGTTILSPR